MQKRGEYVIYGYGLWFVVNAYDTLIMDIWLFCHDKHYRIPGTEDMVKEYENPWFHVKCGLRGCVIGIVVCIMQALAVYIISIL